jgi:hypothetical protein
MIVGMLRSPQVRKYPALIVRAEGEQTVRPDVRGQEGR